VLATGGVASDSEDDEDNKDKDKDKDKDLTLTLNSQKLLGRTVFPEHLAMLHQRQDTLLVGLAAQVEAGFSKAEEEWEKSVVAWGTFFSLPVLLT
jgi:fructosamine-3-kinase